jgi:hypothetical protein
VKQSSPLPKEAGRGHLRPGSLRLLGAGLTALACSTGSASADGRWQEAAFGAVLVLPPPVVASQVTGGSLVCAQQQWNLRLRVDGPTYTAGASKNASLVIGEQKFRTRVSRSGSYLTISVPQDALEPLKAGSRFSVTETGGARRIAAFGLEGSRKAIEAVAPRCSPVDMSSYEAVIFSETDRGVAPARKLLEGEIRIFEAETKKLPTLSAAMIDLEATMKLVFVKLCGSNSYYGESGCNLTGFASKGKAGQWEEVYNTDGVLLYTDPNARENGWPDLLTLPMSGGTEVYRWRWNGSEYAVIDPVVAEDPAGADETNPQPTRLDGRSPEAVSGDGNSVRSGNRKTPTPG